MRTVYTNGEYLPENEAKVSIFDRGFLFADAVYEVVSVLDGKLIDFAGHMARLNRSLDELEMKTPVSEDEFLAIFRKLVAVNEVTNGMVYMQVTRGAADRDFHYPDADTPPTLVAFTQATDPEENTMAKRGARVIVVEDQRWGRRDIKTTQLLFSSMAKMMAQKVGVDDAWLEEDGFINEGTSNNTWIVTDDGTLVTRNLSTSILHGITRSAVLRVAELLQLKVEERPYSVAEAKAAKEAFFTSASAFVCPVIEIDGATIGSGKPGPVAQKLREIYIEESRKTAV